MIDKSQYRLLSADRLEEFEGYDRVVAQNQLQNCGCIIVSAEFGDPIDDEYELEEIYNNIDLLKESVIKKTKRINEKNNKQNMKKNSVKLTESELRNIISESVKNIIKEDIDKKQLWGAIQNAFMGAEYDKRFEKLVHAAKEIELGINRAEFKYDLNPSELYNVMEFLTARHS